MPTTFNYRYDPLSGTFTPQPTSTVESAPYWADWDPNNPLVREYIEKFGTPPKGTTKYEMRLALQEDAQRQYWDLIRTGNFTEAMRLARDNPYLGSDYVRYAHQQFKAYRQQRQQERFEQRLTDWAKDPYIQMALDELQLSAPDAYTNPLRRQEVELRAYELARSHYEHFQLYGTDHLFGNIWAKINPESSPTKQKVQWEAGTYSIFPEQSSGTKKKSSSYYKDPTWYDTRPKEPTPEGDVKPEDLILIGAP